MTNEEKELVRELITAYIVYSRPQPFSITQKKRLEIDDLEEKLGLNNDK